MTQLQDAGLLESRVGEVLVLAINNPARRNAITAGLFRSLTSSLQQAGADSSIGAVVLTGTGNYFCAGGDLKQLMQRREQSEEQRRERLDELNHVVRTLRDFHKPIVAAIEGGAAGAGWSLALACDLVVAANDASFSAAYVKVGLTPDGGITGLLAQILPRQLYTQLCLTGEPIQAQRLAALGAINVLSAPGSALQDSVELATKLAAGPARAMQRIKFLCRTADSALLDEQLEKEAGFMVEAQGSSESAEGIAAFFERRSPNFSSLRV
ncbi:enoyl-CoA hydratase [Achromobacter sp. K91]|uniref:oxepin-CoA hydrolase, alternative type n=1 Tax=Achromobacter sp. K91 TaxID=2292262 RepID=UPI000E66083D|nr:enoyl-CoA hydratase [Achromobacter sp. K91]RIJ03245.1 enoyl-CoA hydratase [Achromobacter sp. K91]